MRLTTAAVTLEKVRVVDILLPPQQGRAASARVTAFEVVEKTIDLPHRRMDEFGGIAPGPARQQPRPARNQDKSAGEQEGRPEKSGYKKTDRPGRDQHPASLSRQLVD